MEIKNKSLGVFDDLDLMIMILALEDFAEKAKSLIDDGCKIIPVSVNKDLVKRALKLRDRFSKLK